MRTGNASAMSGHVCVRSHTSSRSLILGSVDRSVAFASLFRPTGGVMGRWRTEPACRIAPEKYNRVQDNFRNLSNRPVLPAATSARWPTSRATRFDNL